MLMIDCSGHESNNEDGNIGGDAGAWCRWQGKLVVRAVNCSDASSSKASGIVSVCVVLC